MLYHYLYKATSVTCFGKPNRSLKSTLKLKSAKCPQIWRSYASVLEAKTWNMETQPFFSLSTCFNVKFLSISASGEPFKSFNMLDSQNFMFKSSKFRDNLDSKRKRVIWSSEKKCYHIKVSIQKQMRILTFCSAKGIPFYRMRSLRGAII